MTRVCLAARDFRRAEISMTKSSTEERTMKLKLPPGKFAAYLFDCDGTIADSMPLHYIAWKQALEKWNCEFEEKVFYAWGGMPTAEIIATLNKQQGPNMVVDTVCAEKENLYYEMLPQLKAIAEVVEHIEAQHKRIPFAVVSGGTLETVVASLPAVNLLDNFNVFVCAGDYKKGKPDPEPFLLAAERLGVNPKDCLVFEDTAMGIQAATAAGMASVRVPAPWAREGSCRGGACSARRNHDHNVSFVRHTESALPGFFPNKNLTSPAPAS